MKNQKWVDKNLIVSVFTFNAQFSTITLEKKHLFQYLIQLLTNLGPEWCAEHSGVFTPFIYFHFQKYHITNVNHKKDLALVQKTLEIHCLHRK